MKLRAKKGDHVSISLQGNQYITGYFVEDGLIELIPRYPNGNGTVSVRYTQYNPEMVISFQYSVTEGAIKTKESLPA